MEEWTPEQKNTDYNKMVADVLGTLNFGKGKDKGLTIKIKPNVRSSKEDHAQNLE